MAANPDHLPPPGSPLQYLSWWQWGGVYAIYATIMFTAADSDKYGEVAAAIAWLVLLGAVVYWWNPLAFHLSELTGANITNIPAGSRL